jgi:hypothetical protein
VLQAPVGHFVAISSTHWVDLVGERLYTTTDAGKHWTSLVPKPDFSVPGVAELDFASSRDGWLVGTANPHGPLSAGPWALDYTTNGGRTWQPLAKQ